MSVVNAVILGERRMLVAADSAHEGLRRDGTHWAAKPVLKLWQVSPAPVFATGRGSYPMILAFARRAKRRPAMLDAPPEETILWLNRKFRLLARWCRMPREMDRIQLITAGWDASLGKMTIREYQQVDRDAGFSLDPDWPSSIAPWDSSIDRYTDVKGRDDMVALMQQQFALTHALGRPHAAKLPIELLDIGAGTFTREVVTEWPASRRRLSLSGAITADELRCGRPS